MSLLKLQPTRIKVEVPDLKLNKLLEWKEPQEPEHVKKYKVSIKPSHKTIKRSES